MKKKIKVGIDFDGVLAYNPFRVIRGPVTYVKQNVFGSKKTHFYIPKNDIEKLVWSIVHESSIFPARGVELLKQRVENNEIEAHLVTARFSFLQKSLYRWLEKYQMTNTFTSITMNDHDQQPHIYKAKIIAEQGFDYYIEDNYDIVSHVAGKTNTKVLWIYNILDRNVEYPHKFPYLESAVRAIQS